MAMRSQCVTLSSPLSLSSLSEIVLTHRLLDSSTSALIPLRSSCDSLAIPFFSRSTILRSHLDIFLLCREFESSWSTRIHQLPFHLCHSSSSSTRPQGMPLSHKFDPLDSAASVILLYIHCVRSSSFMISDLKPPLSSSSSFSSLVNCLCVMSVIPGGDSIFHLSLLMSPSEIVLTSFSKNFEKTKYTKTAKISPVQRTRRETSPPSLLPTKTAQKLIPPRSCFVKKTLKYAGFLGKAGVSPRS